MKTIILSIFLLIFTGCEAGYRAKGGTSRHVAATGASTEIRQSENPKDATTSENSSRVEEEVVVPAGSTYKEAHVEFNPKTKQFETNWWEAFVPAPMTRKRIIEDQSKVNQGGSWKDTVGDIIAKMKAAKPIQFGGLALILFGAFLFTPYAKVITGGSTTIGWIVMGAGAAIVAIPFLIVGNEKLVIVLAFICGVVPVAWIVAHRHGEHKATATALQGFIDANKNGVDDRTE